MSKYPTKTVVTRDLACVCKAITDALLLIDSGEYHADSHQGQEDRRRKAAALLEREHVRIFDAYGFVAMTDALNAAQADPANHATDRAETVGPAISSRRFGSTPYVHETE